MKSKLAELFEWWDSLGTPEKPLMDWKGYEVMIKASTLLAEEQAQKPCENCDGTGTLRGLTDEGGNRLPCPICSGRGETYRKAEYYVVEKEKASGVPEASEAPEAPTVPV